MGLSSALGVAILRLLRRIANDPPCTQDEDRGIGGYGYESGNGGSEYFLMAGIATEMTATRSGVGPLTASARVFATVKWIGLMTCLVCGGTAYAQHPQTVRAPKGYNVSEVRGGLYFL